jgi:hypothetical protein
MTTKNTARNPALNAVPPGVIRADEAYRNDEFMSRVGQTKYGMRAARRKGLRVSYLHGRCYILGADWFAYLAARREAGDDEQVQSDADG